MHLTEENKKTPAKFHNTVGIQGEFLFEAEQRCESQQEKVLTFFKNHPGMGFTPFDVHKALFDSKTPITSVRRAITNLQRAGWIIKTDMKVIQQYGMVNHKWIYQEKTAA